MQPKNFNSLFELIQALKTFQKSAHNRILVIDDEEFCLSSMQALLCRLGVDVEKQVDFCINGCEALEMATQSRLLGMNYKLIFTDFNMPVMNGIEATKYLREILSDEPMIVGVTGYASSEYHQIGKAAGMNIVVSKPLYI